MRLLPTVQFIRSHARSGFYQETIHAGAVMDDRDIAIADLERALLTGEIIEEYSDDYPEPSCLLLGWSRDGNPLHVVCSRGNTEPALRIITVYRPDPAQWDPDFITRKEG